MLFATPDRKAPDRPLQRFSPLFLQRRFAVERDALVRWARSSRPRAMRVETAARETGRKRPRRVPGLTRSRESRAFHRRMSCCPPSGQHLKPIWISIKLL